jgi:transcriptional regulator with GAF, ATPase, and Fis domain
LTIRGRRLELGPPIGAGATSTVFRAQTGNISVALKLGRGPAQRPRFADECARLAWVSSPELLTVLDAGVVREEVELPDGSRLEAGSPFLLLEWFDGEALEPGRDESPELARELALVVARDIGRALADLHAAGSAHGDVKPANILVARDAAGKPLRARLVDFGLSVEATEVVPRGGTRRYLAPEVQEAGGDARLRDLFALGAVLAELLSPALARAERLPPEFARDLPGELGRLARVLSASAPAARPSARWVQDRARELLAERESVDASAGRRRAAVRRAYLAVRKDEILEAARSDAIEVDVTGEPGLWLREALALARAVAELRKDQGGAAASRLGELSAHGRTRWLVGLIGPSAASWPEGAWGDDAGLAERLLGAVRLRDPESLVFADLVVEGDRALRDFRASDSVELALGLALDSPDAGLIDELEARSAAGRVPEQLAFALSRRLRRRGELGRALAVLERIPGDEARAEAAELARRAGDNRAALASLDELLSRPLGVRARARAVATRARLLLDRADARGAAEMLAAEPDSTAVLETRALAELALGSPARALSLVGRAASLADGDEERARIEAVRGNVAHASGEAEPALRAFRSAAEHAARAGAVLEEATYLTGVAAAATSLGELGEALLAARRSVLLFEALGRRVEAARAMLSVASSHAALGSLDEARGAAVEAIARARALGDRRCAGFAHLVLADLEEPPSLVALEHARYARAQFPEGDDALRAAARLWLHGETELELERFDALGRAATSALEARLEWWGARAQVEAARNDPQRPELVMAELAALASGPVVARGPALSAGARLAARVGDGEMARRLTLAAGDAARELVRRATPAQRAQLSSLFWVRAAEAAHVESRFSAEQIEDVEALVRALGRRDRLRALLRQVVDALVLWTGVERGLLLLRGPGGLLRPRAARNLARSDLSGEQLALSRSLAERALEAGEPVVAVDAAGDLPEIHASAHALKLRSVLAVPLVAHGEALGVVYLDDRVRRGAFGPAELGWVRLVATLAAVAISDARAQLLLRRSVRRAERAEARLAGELARREAELDVAERELARATRGRETRFAYAAIVGDSEAVRAMLRVVDRVTASEVPVLVVGESGSGKELVARAIHGNGPRARGPFVSENCGAVPETLLESTLFGHVRGAFTGAVRPRAGLFEVAHQGTLFLDEIAEMSLGMQAKLLRALQDGEIRPVGSENARRVDVRVIGATHRDLEALVREGRFREDLLYRLNVISVRVPPLRERTGDVPLLVQHFMKVHAGGRRVRVSRAALDALSAFSWPGNVRQLENEIRRALVLSDEMILTEHLSPDVRDRATGEIQRADGLNLRKRLDALEADLVRTALKRTQGNQTRAAELLGVSRFGLQKMMKRLEIKNEAGRLSEAG